MKHFSGSWAENEILVQAHIIFLLLKVSKIQSYPLSTNLV